MAFDEKDRRSFSGGELTSNGETNGASPNDLGGQGVSKLSAVIGSDVDPYSMGEISVEISCC